MGAMKQVESKHLCKAEFTGTCEGISANKQFAYWALNMVNSHIELCSQR